MGSGQLGWRAVQLEGSMVDFGERVSGKVEWRPFSYASELTEWNVA